MTETQDLLISKIEVNRLLVCYFVVVVSSQALIGLLNAVIVFQTEQVIRRNAEKGVAELVIYSRILGAFAESLLLPLGK